MPCSRMGAVHTATRLYVYDVKPNATTTALVPVALTASQVACASFCDLNCCKPRSPSTSTRHVGVVTFVLVCLCLMPVPLHEKQTPPLTVLNQIFPSPAHLSHCKFFILFNPFPVVVDDQYKPLPARYKPLPVNILPVASGVGLCQNAIISAPWRVIIDVRRYGEASVCT